MEHALQKENVGVFRRSRNSRHQAVRIAEGKSTANKKEPNPQCNKVELCEVLFTGKNIAYCVYG